MDLFFRKSYNDYIINKRRLLKFIHAHWISVEKNFDNFILQVLIAEIAQPVRALDCNSKGPWFEPRFRLSIFHYPFINILLKGTGFQFKKLGTPIYTSKFVQLKRTLTILYYKY